MVIFYKKYAKSEQYDVLLFQHDAPLSYLLLGVELSEEAENGDVDQDLESARRLREPGVPRYPLGTPNCCSTISRFYCIGLSVCIFICLISYKAIT